MTDNELDILKINAAARARGLSYGKFVSMSTAEELEQITGRRVLIPRNTAQGRKKRKSAPA